MGNAEPPGKEPLLDASGGDVAFWVVGILVILYATLLTDDLTNATLAFLDDPNTPITPENSIAPVLDCEPFPDYETAQPYLAANPEEQVTIDPDFDGLACDNIR